MTYRNAVVLEPFQIKNIYCEMTLEKGQESIVRLFGIRVGS